MIQAIVSKHFRLRLEAYDRAKRYMLSGWLSGRGVVSSLYESVLIDPDLFRGSGNTLLSLPMNETFLRSGFPSIRPVNYTAFWLESPCVSYSIMWGDGFVGVLKINGEYIPFAQGLTGPLEDFYWEVFERYLNARGVSAANFFRPSGTDEFSIGPESLAVSKELALQSALMFNSYELGTVGTDTEVYRRRLKYAYQATLNGCE